MERVALVESASTNSILGVKRRLIIDSDAL
jgi:hypothetical protein